MTNQIIATHSGAFHADEAMAVAIIKILLEFRNEYDKTFEIVRTRNPKHLAEAGFVVDVGGVYEPSKNRFDHHMTDCRKPRLNGVAYSSAGLVWDEFGREICGGNQRMVELIDERLIQPIDLNDTGTAAKVFIAEGIEDMSLSKMIDNLNPNWREVEKCENLPVFLDCRFEDAAALCYRILQRFIRNVQAEVLGELALKQAITAGTTEYIVLPGPLNWNYKGSPIFATKVKFVIHIALDGDYCAVAVPPSFDKPFEQRKPFPAAWNWKRGKELADLTGVRDAVFSHGAGFIAIAHSDDGAARLAELALES